MNNPFKFGTIVDEPYFINRKKEIAKVLSLLGSENHLVVISPRRFGKSSLIFRVVKLVNRPVISVDMQLVTSPADLAAQLLKRVYRLFPAERLKRYLKNFRIMPTLSLNPATGGIDVSFMPGTDHVPLLEDVLGLIEKISTAQNKIIVIFDEFQDAVKMDPDLLKQMRAVMQHHKMVNYVFLGSQESLIREIFQKKKSPFYHFGMVMNLLKIDSNEFREFLTKGFSTVSKNAEGIAGDILKITRNHPFYTQQLAFTVWERAVASGDKPDIVSDAVGELIMMHDMDYERIWLNFNKTDRKMLLGLSLSDMQPLSDAFNRKWDIGAPSTAFSSLKRLMASGFVIKTESYEPDDPFFSLWLRGRRER
jgi:hypothetical protein